MQSRRKGGNVRLELRPRSAASLQRAHTEQEAYWNGARVCSQWRMFANKRCLQSAGKQASKQARIDKDVYDARLPGELYVRARSSFLRGPFAGYPRPLFNPAKRLDLPPFTRLHAYRLGAFCPPLELRRAGARLARPHQMPVGKRTGPLRAPCAPPRHFAAPAKRSSALARRPSARPYPLAARQTMLLAAATAQAFVAGCAGTFPIASAAGLLVS